MQLSKREKKSMYIWYSSILRRRMIRLITIEQLNYYKITDWGRNLRKLFTNVWDMGWGYNHSQTTIIFLVNPL